MFFDYYYYYCYCKNYFKQQKQLLEFQPLNRLYLLFIHKDEFIFQYYFLDIKYYTF